jgi:hypothetical protein
MSNLVDCQSQTMDENESALRWENAVIAVFEHEIVYSEH